MLLFTVEDPEADDNRLPLAFSSRGYPLRPVTVRAVELGLETFRPGTFPNEFDQLLFLTSDEYSFESIKKYNSDEQQMRRFSEWVMLKRKRWPLLCTIQDRRLDRKGFQVGELYYPSPSQYAEHHGYYRRSNCRTASSDWN
jgi:hypothetical protein